MGSIRTSRALRPSRWPLVRRLGGEVRPSAERRRFVLAVVSFGVLFGALGRIWGEDIALKLQETPVTNLGWLFVGWLIAGPPYLIALLIWHERRRLRTDQRRNATYLVAVWIGLNMFVVPARFEGVASQFGTAALVGDPLSVGWAWGSLANLVGFGFAALVLTVLYKSVPDRPTKAQRDMTIRFLERAWLLLLVVALGFALYGRDAGLFNSGT